MVGLAKADDPIVEALLEQDKTPWYKKHNLRILYALLVPTCMGVEMTSGFDSSMMNGLQSVVYWDEFFNFPRDHLLGLMGSIYSLGAICSLPLAAYLNDRIGRRKTIVAGSSVMVFAACLQAASQNFAMFVCSRLILGFGIPACIIGASSLIGELSYPKERPVMTSLFNTSWFIGSICAAGVTYGTYAMQSNWGWRLPSLLQAVPSLMQISFMWWLPESPRWLISKDRSEEALAILIKYHAEGDPNSEFVKYEYDQISNTLQIEMENSKRSWKELFATQGMRRRALLSGALGLFNQWSGNVLISYYLPRILDTIGITNKRTKQQINLARSSWEWVNGSAAAFAVFYFRRRTMYLACTIGLLTVYTTWTAASAQYQKTQDPHAAKAVVALIFLYSPCYNMGYNALIYTYLVEIWPFHMRAKGVAFFQLFSRSAGFFNNYVNPIGLARIGWKYYISYCCLLCVEIVFVYFLFPETSGKTLEELAFLFEPEEMQAQKDRAVARALKNKDTEGEVTHIESINDGAKMAGDTERVGSGEKSPPTYTAVTKD